MFDSIKSRAATVVMIGAASALTVGGIALAQGGSSGSGAQTGPAPHAHRMPPPGPGGPMGKDLTYAEFHVRRNGAEVVVRLDRGQVVTASASSITVKENDGSLVTTAVDAGTKVLAGPGRSLAPQDIKQGSEVMVSGPEGAAAKRIVVLPPQGAKPGNAPAAGPNG